MTDIHRTMGLKAALVPKILEMRPGTKLTIDHCIKLAGARFKECSRSSFSNITASLCNEGELSRIGKGIYVKTGPSVVTASNGYDPERVVIEELLTAMANAEPVLQKWSKIHEMLKDL